MTWTYLLIFATLLFAACLAGFAILSKALKKVTIQTKQDLQNLRYELNTKTAQTALELYRQLPGQETVVYDSSAWLPEKDFTGAGAQTWNYVAHRFDPEIGAGRHEITNSEIIVHRTNTAGRYELHLKRYNIEGQTSETIPATLRKNQRNLRLVCEVKREAASHVLRFVFKGISSKEVLDEKDYVVFNPEWEKIEAVFSISANEACTLRIDDLLALQAPSVIRLRNLVLFEKQ